MNLDLDIQEAKKRVLTQVAEEEENGTMVIFTDGFLGEGGGGSVAFSRVESRSLSCPPVFIINNELELLAIVLAIAQFKYHCHGIKNQSRHKALAIFRKSQVALKQTHEPPFHCQ